MNYYKLQDGVILEGPVASLSGGEFPREQGWIPEWELEGFLNDLKVSKQREINLKRDELEAAGFPYGSAIIDSDERSVKRISIAVSAALVSLQFQQPFKVFWAAQDNSILELDAAGMIGMNLALAEYATQLHYAARQAKMQIEQANSVQEVLAVQAVWPSRG